MPRPEKVSNLEDVIHWIQDHDGRIDAYWEQQHKWNARIETQMGEVYTRLTAIEKRVVFFAGAAAAAGALIGNFVQVFGK